MADTEIITYSLRGNNRNSDSYYKKIETFSDKVLEYINLQAGDIISRYKNFLLKNSEEVLRSDGEYAVELLTIGMTWKRYLGASQATPRFLLCFLVRLFLLRRSFQNAKPYIDKIRGYCLSNSITPAIGSIPYDDEYSLENFNRLILWLEATGEFKDEAKRLKNWSLFFENKFSFVVERIISTSLLVFEWFESNSEKELGEYLPGLQSFLAIKHKEYKFREDEIFTGKEPVEYYLNMVGSEIMNRGFRPGFNKTKHHVLLLPGCMRIDQDKCRAVTEVSDIKCTGCNNFCRVNELSKLGRENNFEVCIIPHSSGFTQWLKRWQQEKETGLVAVACLLNLVPGGYEMRELNLNAQCVLLDYCGCKKHWHDTGIPTDLNEDRILQLVKK